MADTAKENAKAKAQKQKKAGKRKSRLALLRTGVMLVFWCALIGFCLYYREDISVESIVTYTPSNLFAAAAIMLLLFALKGITVIIYGGILYAASGVLFPLPMAVLVNVLGTVLMTSIPFFVGRRAGKALLGHLAEKSEKLQHLQHLSPDRVFVTCLSVRIVGLLPGDLVGMACGASGFRYSSYLAGTLTGMFPSVIIFSVMGKSARDVSSPVFWASLACGILFMLIPFLLFLIRRKKKGGNEPVCPEGILNAADIPDGGTNAPGGGTNAPDGGAMTPDGGINAPDGGAMAPRERRIPGAERKESTE